MVIVVKSGSPSTTQMVLVTSGTMITSVLVMVRIISTGRSSMNPAQVIGGWLKDGTERTIQWRSIILVQLVRVAVDRFLSFLVCLLVGVVVCFWRWVFFVSSRFYLSGGDEEKLRRNKMEDDFKLLKKMLEDAKKTEEIYKPTNYWNNYVDKIVNELKENGMNHVRGKKDSVFSVFGGSEEQPDYFRIQKNNRFLPHRLKKYFSVFSTISKQDLQSLAYYQVFYYDRLYNINKLEPLSVSLEDMNGRPYTISFLQYYLQYLYMSRFIDFNEVKVFVDLGCGMSRVSEIIHRLHPDVSIFLFDIVPTLYCTEYMMRETFPCDVVGYMETKDYVDLNHVEAGKIHVLPNWKFPLVRLLSSIDVFMNSGSFQEMEPDVVRNYLSFINRRAEWVYLRAAMSGSEKAERRGDFGSINPVVLEDYVRGLSGCSVFDRSMSVFPLIMKPGYEDIIFKRKNEKRVVT